MRKYIIYALTIILWWFVGSMLSIIIVNSIKYNKIIDKFTSMLSFNYIYSLLIYTPFIVSCLISTIVISAIYHVVTYDDNIWRVSLILLLFGSIPFTILSSYQNQIALLIIKLFIMGISVIIFGYLGALIGNCVNKLLKNGREHNGEHNGVRP
jgi:hypothetical protein